MDKDLINRKFMLVDDEDIYSISEYFCKVINRVYRAIDVKETRRTKSYDDQLNRLFKLNENQHHNLIEASCWLIEDSELAIQSFKTYGIEGPIEVGNDHSEKYLRLYGFLQAVYNQRSGYLKLYELFQLTNIKNEKKIFRNVKILEARNMVSSHSLDYSGSDSDKDFFKLVQSSLDTTSVKVVGKINYFDLNLNTELNNFYSFIYPKYIELLDHVRGRYFSDGHYHFIYMNESINILNAKIEKFKSSLN